MGVQVKITVEHRSGKIEKICPCNETTYSAQTTTYVPTLQALEDSRTSAVMYTVLLLLLLASFQHVMTYECDENIEKNPYPQFQIVAAAKTGSTSLYSYLCDHPLIECAAKKKELNLLRSNNIRIRTDKVNFSRENQ